MKKVTSIERNGPYIHTVYSDGSHMVTEDGCNLEWKHRERRIAWFFWIMLGAYVLATLALVWRIG